MREYDKYAAERLGGVLNQAVRPATDEEIEQGRRLGELHNKCARNVDVIRSYGNPEDLQELERITRPIAARVIERG